MHNTHTIKLRTYIIGFVSSIVTTLFAYLLVVTHAIDSHYIFAAITLLAVVQVLIQLVCFLHLNSTSTRRWNVAALLFTVVVIVILLVGTVWIMNNLTDRTMNTMRGDGTINVQNAY
jgi:cytochrome o ubiquinol oxidase operon protein cyoD